MTDFDYQRAPLPVRPDITAAQGRAWRRLGRPGTWLSGAERLAVATEVRQAGHCALCETRRTALSPYAVAGSHDHLDSLPEAWVEAIHRIASDPGRLTRAWFDGITETLEETRYIEIVGIVLTVVSVDTFCHALEISSPDLPKVEAGEPTRIRPAAARRSTHWVATIDPDEAAAGESDLYAGTNGANIYRALSLVPNEARVFRDLDDHLYLPCEAIFDFENEYRALNHAQLELVAGRVSALNQCLY
ncbi:MAG: alkylhydroperoxidase-related (seleno)protein [Alphaproteobacteria bacterium]|jgi:hypothetical protein|nr:alkylhydroperoxidase-related (seleno)protein [Alphaproteobacteria bacterium]